MTKKNSGTGPKKTTAAAKKKVAANGPRTSWLDAESHQPAIEDYARRLGPFVEAMADGKIDESEVQAQEKRLVKLMQEIEPSLPDDLHGKITQLLCELTAYNLMHILHQIEQARPRAAFQG